MIHALYSSARCQLQSLLLLLVAFATLVSVSGTANAGQATLAWDANTQPEVVGYMVYYGTASGAYSGKVDAGNATQYTLSGLLDGTTYYYAVTAYDLGRTESAFSNEVSAAVPSAAPVANFSANSTTGVAPLSVSFTSTSTGSILGYAWTFGDGTSSTSATPTHSYTAAGTYSVGLTVTGPGGTNTMTKAGYITVSTATTTAPVASFTSTSTSGVAPLTVTFSSTSTGSISGYSWNFGDGTGSTVANPSHTYSNVGTYTVSLTVTGSGGSNTMTKSNYVTTSSPPTPTANEIIVDNLAAGLQDATRTFTGKWCKSSGSGYYGTVSIFSCGTTADKYRWSFSTLTTGSYDVYVRWSIANKRSTAVPITVNADSGLTTKNFNQTVNGGQWVLHGRYNFTAGVAKYVEASAANGLACADAVRIVPVTTTATTSGLVAAYGFNEGTGTAAVDSSGKGNNGVVSSATWVSTGRFGKALSFNGTGSWVTVADSASLDITSGMTLEAWVYPTAAMTGWRTVIMKEQPSADIYYLSANTDVNQPATGVSVAGSSRELDAGTTIPVNAWTHLAATYDGTTQRLYINGVQVASRAQTGSIATSTGALRVGGNSVWGEFFQGYIDEVRIYSRALSAGEIQTDLGKAIQ